MKSMHILQPTKSYKLFILFLLVFLCFGAGAQNRLTELYDLTPGSNFPPNMPHVKQWIDRTLAGVFVRNLQYSDNVKSASKFMSFTPVSRGGILPLYNAGGLQIKFAKGDVMMQYDYEIRNYLAFDITTFDRSQRSYFKLATDVLKIKPEEIIANAMNMMIERDGKRSMYQIFIDQVNKKMNSKLPYPKDETVKETAQIIQKQYPGKIYDIVFDTYIKGKDDNDTWMRMERFFNITGFFRERVAEKLDDMMSPKIQFRQNATQDINLARVLGKASGMADDTTTIFQSTHAAGILNYRDRTFELTFNGKLNHPANLMYTKYVNYQGSSNKPKLVSPGKQMGENVELTQLTIMVTEQGLIVRGVSKDQYTFEVFNKPWN